MLYKNFDNNFLCPAVIYTSKLFSLIERLQVWNVISLFPNASVCCKTHIFSLIVKFPSPVAKSMLFCLIYGVKYFKEGTKQVSTPGINGSSSTAGGW